MTYSAGVKTVAGRKGDVALTVADVSGAISQAQLDQALSGISVNAGNVAVVEIGNASGQSFAGSTNAGVLHSFLVYQVVDVNDHSDLLMLSVDMKVLSSIGAKFHYDIWQGDPTGSNPSDARLLVIGNDVLAGLSGYHAEFQDAATSYVPNAALRQGIFLVITNLLSSPFTLAYKLDFAKFPPPSSVITLADPSTSSFTYTGPDGLTTAHVGPGQTFPQPADAIAHMSTTAPWTMILHPGTYYRGCTIPAGMDGFTITASSDGNADNIICDGRGGWVTGVPLWLGDDPPGSGPVNPFRLAQGKGFFLAHSPGTISKIGFWNCGGAYGRSVVYNGVQYNTGDAESGIYAEFFTSPGTFTIDRCTFDACENGVFIPKIGGENITFHLTNCDFSAAAPNGLSTDGLSHNVYIQAAHSIVDNCNFFDCNGNSFKSRSPVLDISNSMMMQGLGRAIDYPDGGTLTVNNVHFVQKIWGAGETRIHNFIGLSNENPSNTPGGAGTPAALATFTNCTIDIAYDATFLIHYGGLATWTGTTYNWYHESADPGGPAFSYDTDHGSDVGGVTGLTFTPPNGTTFITGYPPRPTALKHTS